MSTGADCYFYEEKPSEWFYKLQQWPYGEWPEYDKYGPFETYGKAVRHLHAHHANPGGYSSRPLPGCPHDLMQDSGDPRYRGVCDRCGAWIK